MPTYLYNRVIFQKVWVTSDSHVFSERAFSERALCYQNSFISNILLILIRITTQGEGGNS